MKKTELGSLRRGDGYSLTYLPSAASGVVRKTREDSHMYTAMAVLYLANVDKLVAWALIYMHPHGFVNNGFVGNRFET